MLGELLTDKRMTFITRISNWEEAIQLSAQPLVDEGSIEVGYIGAMIESVKKYGPYIVLADGFALPHAEGKGKVSKLSLALLQVEEAVDLMGKPVNVFLVLATKDHTSHMEVLREVAELLYDTTNLEILRSGSKEEILSLIK